MGAAGRALLLASLAMTCAVPPADAAWRARRPHPVSTDPATLCEQAIATAEDRYETPPALLTAISLVETGRPDRGRDRAWPWSVDVDGTGYMFPTRDAAAGFARTALLAGAQSVDVGCMQVNLEQHPDAFRSIDEGFDPRRNVDYATRFLLSLHAGPARSVWATAVGFYHSQTPAIAAPYQARVLAIHDTIAPSGAPPLDDGAANAKPRTARRHTRLDALQQAWAATLPSAPGTELRLAEDAPRRPGDFDPRGSGDPDAGPAGDLDPRRAGDMDPRRSGDIDPRRAGDIDPRRAGDAEAP